MSKSGILHISHKDIEVYRDIWILKHMLMFPRIQSRIIYETERYMRDNSTQSYVVEYNYLIGDSQQQVWKYRLAERSRTLGQVLVMPSILWVPRILPEKELDVHWENLRTGD